MTVDHTAPAVVLTAGRFGRAVASRLTDAHPDLVVEALTDALPTLEHTLGHCSFLFVATWRRHPAACEMVDAACAAGGVPWSGVTMDGTVLVMGPVVTTPAGPCFRCVERRRLAHLEDRARAATLDEAYDADPAIGCEGFLPGAVTMAAASFESDLADLVGGTAAAGRVRLLDLIQLDLTETRVPRVHGCERCRPQPGGPDRYLRHLRPHLGVPK